MAWRAVTDKQWQLIKAQLLKPRRFRKAGRPQLVSGNFVVLFTNPMVQSLP